MQARRQEFGWSNDDEGLFSRQDELRTHTLWPKKPECAAAKNVDCDFPLLPYHSRPAALSWSCLGDISMRDREPHRKTPVPQH
jgi:hypothetical protein